MPQNTSTAFVLIMEKALAAIEYTINRKCAVRQRSSVVRQPELL
jgi:hypothetical protein